MKKLFAVIKWLLVAACFSSCCVFPYYINEENIMCKKPETIKSVDNEFCLLIGGTPSFKTHCMLYQLYDTSEAIFDIDNIKVFCGKNLLKAKVEKLEDRNWKEIGNIVNLSGESLVCFSFKARLHDGDTIKVISRDFPCKGDSIETRILYTHFEQTSQMINNPKIRYILMNDAISLF